MRILAAVLLSVLATSALAQPAPKRVTNPDWIKRPGPDEVRAAWPLEALRTGKGGRATIRCAVEATGLLSGCAVTSEEPAGLGFGAAALSLAGSFRMRPRMEDGVPVAGATVQIPIAFQLPAAFKPAELKRGTLQTPPWVAAPTRAEVRRAYSGRDGGRVILRCAMASGQLTRCQTFSGAAGGGLVQAALGLTDRFRAAGSAEDLARLDGLNVNVSFDFTAALSTTPRRLTRPRWTRSIDPAAIRVLFPAAARQAGVTTGQGSVECTVGVTGGLETCRIVGEQPVDLGFGDAAARAASALAVSLWDDEGWPTEGAVIRLPIRFNLTGTTSPAP